LLSAYQGFERRVATFYDLSGIPDARRELAEFQKLREMKHRLQEVYHEMRVEPVHQEQPDPDVPN
jgi:hypothetical protein